MKSFLSGCAVVVLIWVGIITIPALFLWNQLSQPRQDVSGDEAIQTALVQAVSSIGEFDIDVNSTESFTRITVSVPFDPNAGDQAAKVATVILRLTHTYLFYMPPNLLEIRLYRVISSGGRMALQERTFLRDLKMPLPVPGRPKL